MFFLLQMVYEKKYANLRTDSAVNSKTFSTYISCAYQFFFYPGYSIKIKVNL